MTCKLSLSSPFISIRIKLFVARSVVRSVVYSCAALSRIYVKRGNNHTLVFFAPFLSERDHEFSSAKKTANKRGEEEDSRPPRIKGVAFIFFSSSLERAKTVAPREETNKNLKSFSKKKNQFFSFRSFCTKITHVKHNGSYETNRS